MLRRFIEKSIKIIAFRRSLPASFGGAPIDVSPSASLFRSSGLQPHSPAPVQFVAAATESIDLRAFNIAQRSPPPIETCHAKGIP